MDKFFRKVSVEFDATCKTIKIIVIPGSAEYLPWRLSETPPTITTKDVIIKIDIR